MELKYKVNKPFTGVNENETGYPAYPSMPSKPCIFHHNTSYNYFSRLQLTFSFKRTVIFFGILCYSILTSFNFCYSQTYKIKTVVIDAGHGGNDPGCIGNKLKEKDAALSIALKVGAYIEKKFPEVKVIYTRKTDVFVELYKRAQTANDAKADLFICIHCNANPSKNPLGSETYVMGLHKSQANLAVAQKENSSILMEDSYQSNYDGFDPNSTEAYIIFSLFQNAFLDQSLSIASKVQKQFKTKTALADRGVKQAGFLVLWKTAMPSILIETGFLSNVHDEQILASAKGQESVATAIYNAFREYKNEVEGNKNNDTDDKEIVLSADTAAFVADAKDSISGYKDTVKSKKEIFFKVQFASSSVKKSLTSPDFKGLSGVKEYYHGGMYKYVVGEESTFEAALTLLDKVHSSGFKDAFVIAFLNGERITPQEAVKLIKGN